MWARIITAVLVAVLAPACRDKPAEPPAAAPAGAIGVPACDEYLDKMARCIEKLAPESKEALRAGTEDTVRGWRETAATAEGKATLATACGQALEAGKSAAEAMGCDW